MLAPLIVAQTVSQLQAGIDLAPGEIVGPIIGFAILALFACSCLIALLRRIPPTISVIRCATPPQWEIVNHETADGMTT